MNIEKAIGLKTAALLAGCTKNAIRAAASYGHLTAYVSKDESVTLYDPAEVKKWAKGKTFGSVGRTAASDS